MDYILLNVYIMLLIFLHNGGAMEYTVCYEWESPATVQLDCDSDKMIHLRSVMGGRQQTSPPANDFCQYPSADTTNDCFGTDDIIEKILFQKCNFVSHCSERMPFVNLPDCTDQGFVGQRYFYIEYDCLSRNRHGSSILFQPMQNLQPPPESFETTSFFYLSTQGYPNYITAEKNLCELSLAGQSKLSIKIMDIRAIDSDLCAYRLYLNDRELQFTKCAKQLWDGTHNNEFEFSNSESSNKLIQIAFQRQRSDNSQAKLWLELQTVSLVSRMEENHGILDLSCDFSAAIWPTPPGQTSTTVTTSTPGSTPNHVPTTTTPSSSTTEDSESGTPAEIQKEKSKEDKSLFLPIIGGVVAGGLVVLVIIIIIIVLLVRRYQINHKPAKSLDVIDAWDDASTLGEKKAVSNYSNGSNYDPPSTTISTISPYETNHSPRQSYMMNGELYAEIPELPSTKSTRSLSNHGYIFEDDLYSDGVHHNGNKVLMNGSSILPGSLDRRRVSELYAKPNKVKRKPVLSTSTVSSGGFDNPDFAGDIYEQAHKLDLQEDIYGYSTSLA